MGGGYKAIDHRSVGHLPLACQTRLSVPSVTAHVVPPGADHAPTPAASLPPSVCQSRLTPAVEPANSSYHAALSAPRTNATATPGVGVAAPTSPATRPPSDLQPDQCLSGCRTAGQWRLLTENVVPCPMHALGLVVPGRSDPQPGRRMRADVRERDQVHLVGLRAPHREVAAPGLRWCWIVQPGTLGCLRLDSGGLPRQTSPHP